MGETALDHTVEVVNDLRSFASGDFGTAGDIAFEGAAVISSLAAAIGRVRAIHYAVPVQFEDYSTCHACTSQEWPCETIRALERPPVEA